jgi:hypothetical protein
MQSTNLLNSVAKHAPKKQIRKKLEETCKNRKLRIHKKNYLNFLLEALF